MRSIAVTAAAIILSLFVAKAVIYAQSPSPSPSPSPTATPMTPSAAPSTGFGGN